jgi:hypothetical protein
MQRVYILFFLHVCENSEQTVRGYASGQGDPNMMMYAYPFVPSSFPPK